EASRGRRAGMVGASLAIAMALACGPTDGESSLPPPPTKPNQMRTCPSLPDQMEEDELVGIYVYYDGGQDAQLAIVATATTAGRTVSRLTPREGYFIARVDRDAARAICSDARVTSVREVGYSSPT